MKVTIDNGGLFSLTAENEQDNAVLFSITNSKMSNVAYNYPQATTPKKKQSFIKRVLTSTEPAQETHTEAPLTERVAIPVETKRRKYVKSGLYTNAEVAKRKRKQHVRECPVVGCEETPRGRSGLGIHMRMKHGVDQFGVIHETYVQSLGKGRGVDGGSSEERAVPKPVVRLQDGTLKVRPAKQYLTTAE